MSVTKLRLSAHYSICQTPVPHRHIFYIRGRALSVPTPEVKNMQKDTTGRNAYPYNAEVEKRNAMERRLKTAE